MSGLQIKEGNTATQWVGLLSDENGWIDLTSATLIKMVGKITNGVTLLGPFTVTQKSNQAFTATLSSGTNLLSTVSAFTNLSEGSTLVGAGIPPLALVGVADSTAGTITMVDTSGNPVNATKTATAEALTGNQGMTTYTPLAADSANPGVYDIEFAVTLPSGVLIIPNDTSYPTLTINASLDPGVA